MTEFQKVIKYCAIAFAIFLSVTIISGIAAAIMSITGVVTMSSKDESINFNKDFDGIESLRIDNGIGKLSIIAGDTDKVRVVGTNVSSSFTADKNNNHELRVKTKFNFWNFLSNTQNGNVNSSITIYLPSNFSARKVSIDAGAGNMTIDGLTVDKLDINAGIGDIYGYNITAKDVTLDGGAGNITLYEVDLKDTSIDAGVGEIKLQGKLTGRNEIDGGVGNIDLDLLGIIDDYNLKVDSGIGNIYINGQKYSDLSRKNMTADNTLDIDGGLGNINLNFD